MTVTGFSLPSIELHMNFVMGGIQKTKRAMVCASSMGKTNITLGPRPRFINFVLISWSTLSQIYRLDHIVPLSKLS